jgi:hypothetical protein
MYTYPARNTQERDIYFLTSYSILVRLSLYSSDSCSGSGRSRRRHSADRGRGAGATGRGAAGKSASVRQGRGRRIGGDAAFHGAARSVRLLPRPLIDVCVSLLEISCCAPCTTAYALVPNCPLMFVARPRALPHSRHSLLQRLRVHSPSRIPYSDSPGSCPAPLPTSSHRRLNRSKLLCFLSVLHISDSSLIPLRPKGGK